MSGGDYWFIIGLCIGVMVMAVFSDFVVDGYESDFKHNNVVEVTVNTQYKGGC